MYIYNWNKNNYLIIYIHLYTTLQMPMPYLCNNIYILQELHTIRLYASTPFSPIWALYLTT